MTRAFAALAAFLVFFGVLAGSQVRADYDNESYMARPGLSRPSGIFIYYNLRGVLSYDTLTAAELPPGAKPFGEVSGDSCQYGIAVPTAFSIQATDITSAAGDAGFRKVLAGLKIKWPGLVGIYDVKVDVHDLSILGLYRRRCVEIMARGFKL